MITTKPSALLLAALAALATGGAPAAALAQTPEPTALERVAALRPHASLWEALLAAEDARARTRSQLITLLDATRAGEPELRFVAVRALGRLEDAAHADAIAGLLHDAEARVRAAAAHALAQSVVRVQPGPAAAPIQQARHALLEALAATPAGTPTGPTGARSGAAGAAAAAGVERAEAAIADQHAEAAMAESLGRLRHADAGEARATLQLLLPLLERSAVVRLGALRGAFFLSRQPPARGAFDAATLEPVRRIATSAGTQPGAAGGAAGSPRAGAQPGVAPPAAAPASAGDTVGQRTRGLALAILAAAGAADEPTLAAALRDAEPLVRRDAALAAAGHADTAAVRRLLAPALADSAAIVRYEALRGHARRLAASHGCAPLLAATRGGESDAHVALLAIDALGSQCGAQAAARVRLDSIAGTLPSGDEGGWHRAAAALVALAPHDPAAAARRLPAFAGHPNLFVRSYAARAAAALRDEATLRRLARDPHPNVRTEAVVGVRAVAGRTADDVYLEQLTSDDSQLLQRAAGALEGSPHDAAADRLLAAFERVSAARSETARDARRALLQRVHELGAARADPLAARLRPYLRDYDPVIAALTADVIGDWTGARPDPAPTAADRLPLPSFEQTAAAAAAHVTVEMADGSSFTLRLHPLDAPTNAARFLRMASNGVFDGRTFHRVVPAFVVQGGSPTANEYAGEPAFSRDEVGRPNWRGTVGLSTRGRDTGDGQIFINLIDNVRLDHDYTVFATVVDGMAAVDRMLEGAVIRRVTVR